MSAENDIDRGRLAQEVLNNPAFADAFDKIDKEIVSKWRDAKDKDDREHLHRCLMCLQLVKGALSSAVITGQVAQQMLEQKLTWAEKAGKTVRRSLGR